ncbi:AAA family ATPase [Dongia sedimenti]|uniref:AAA family ATPase n=1 Tax=Dongia sedimenti TaxID=3064282 RepID=A0ABU0YPG3_9PROT|nr:AAA family ATPase [Rhodospirillaceae bacterium R-7]
MFFTIVESFREVPGVARNAAFLVTDYWDDWFSFRTMFSLWLFDEEAVRHQVGSVKIGQHALAASGRPAPGAVLPPDTRFPNLEQTFDALDQRFFSLGQDENYYETLNGLSEDLRNRVLIGLRDCAFNLDIFEAERLQQVMQTSLLRSVSEQSVRGRLHRLSMGDATLTEFQFSYAFPPIGDGIDPPSLRFEVTPESHPPTNVHVLIGRNGVGKTRCMRGIAEALLGRAPEDGEPIGRIILDPNAGAEWSFAGLAMISFSAFDDFDLRPKQNDRIRSQQVGLVGWDKDEQGVEYDFMKTPSDLAVDFQQSFNACRQGLRAKRWRAAVETLEADDLFAEANVTALMDMNDEQWGPAAITLFKRLSSGHAIVLLTMTRLVEVVDERTLVLLDEPEGHLHPPLLSAFIRALSDLLVKRNGVAIVATHSPVVLQEVPKLCAWKLRRAREVAVVERPTVETFGENVGILTREVFGFEVTKSGFHRLLDDAVNVRRLNFNAVLEHFDGKLGAEARAIVQALIAERDARL